jgi:hypothetical protein
VYSILTAIRFGVHDSRFRVKRTFNPEPEILNPELINAVGGRTLTGSLIESPMPAVSAIRRFSKTIAANYMRLSHAAFTQGSNRLSAKGAIDWFVDCHRKLPHFHL